MSSHNKKRNSGLLHEFLIRCIANALVEGNKEKSALALKMMKKYFKSGTQLNKELRLINSLVRTTVSSESVAASILSEAQKESLRYDVNKLDNEKSRLIRDINHKLNEDGKFYDAHINDYRVYATVQTLLNDWRSKRVNIAKNAVYKDRLIRHLLAEKKENVDQELDDNAPGLNRLLMSTMMNKLNEKYSGTLSNDQKDVIRTYVWSSTNDDTSRIQEKLNVLKNDIVRSIDSYVAHQDAGSYIVKQLMETKQKLLSESFECPNDASITRFMLYMQLNDEIKTKDE